MSKMYGCQPEGFLFFTPGWEAKFCPNCGKETLVEITGDAKKSWEDGLYREDLQKHNQRLAEALERIYKVESLCERDSLLHALAEINQIADEAIQAYKLLEKKD